MRRAATRSLLFLPALTLVLAACGGDSDPSHDLPSYVLSELDGANDFVRDILVDGTVTPAEYESAVYATLGCVAEHGFPYTNPVYRSGGAAAPHWEYTYGPIPDERLDEFRAVSHECHAQFEGPVVPVWTAQDAPPEEEIQAALAEVARCAREQGLHAPDFDTVRQSLPELDSDERNIFFDCVNRHYTGEVLPN